MILCNLAILEFFQLISIRIKTTTPTTIITCVNPIIMTRSQAPSQNPPIQQQFQFWFPLIRRFGELIVTMSSRIISIKCVYGDLALLISISDCSLPINVQWALGMWKFSDSIDLNYSTQCYQVRQQCTWLIIPGKFVISKKHWIIMSLRLVPLPVPLQLFSASTEPLGSVPHQSHV